MRCGAVRYEQRIHVSWLWAASPEPNHHRLLLLFLAVGAGPKLHAVRGAQLSGLFTTAPGCKVGRYLGLSHQPTVKQYVPICLYLYRHRQSTFRDSLFGPLNHERPCIASVVPDFASCPWTCLVTSQFYLEKRKERRPATPPAKLSPYWQLGNSITPRGFTFSLYDLPTVS